MTDVSTDDVVRRLRRSLTKLQGWALLYKPRMLRERAQYDDDLDEAEDLLEATEAWTAAHTDTPLRIVPKKAP